MWVLCWPYRTIFDVSFLLVIILIANFIRLWCGGVLLNVDFRGVLSL